MARASPAWCSVPGIACRESECPADCHPLSPVSPPPPPSLFAFFARQRLVLRLDGWELGSRYPHGHLVRSLGPINSLKWACFPRVALYLE